MQVKLQFNKQIADTVQKQKQIRQDLKNIKPKQERDTFMAT